MSVHNIFPISARNPQFVVIKSFKVILVGRIPGGHALHILPRRRGLLFFVAFFDVCAELASRAAKATLADEEFGRVILHVVVVVQTENLQQQNVVD